MPHSTKNTGEYTQFPTYRENMAFRPSLMYSFTESDFRQPRHQPSSRTFICEMKRKPTLLLTPKHPRTPLQPRLSPDSSAPSSITQGSQRGSESYLRKNLSDLESMLDYSYFSRNTPSPSPAFPSFLSPRATRMMSSPAPSQPVRKQPRLDDEILGIFLRNNGGYLDDSDESDEDLSPEVESGLSWKKTAPSSSSFGTAQTTPTRSNGHYFKITRSVYRAQKREKSRNPSPLKLRNHFARACPKAKGEGD